MDHRCLQSKKKIYLSSTKQPRQVCLLLGQNAWLEPQGKEREIQDPDEL